MASPRMSKADRLRKLIRDFQWAKTQYGKGYGSQLSEIVRLRRGKGRLGITEYFFYGLYDDRQFNFADKARFLGWRMQDTVDGCTPQDWWITVEDKLVLYGYLQGLGLPIPAVHAVYHPFRTFGAAESLRDRAAVATFLAERATYPFFSKPNHAGCALGVVGIAAYDRETSTLHCINGDRMPLQGYLDHMQPFVDKGYLFQELLTAHPGLIPVTGERVSSLRVIVVVQPDGPQIIRAAWRIPLGKNMADNFSQPGNMMAGIDVATGEVMRAVRGIGTEQQSVPIHPETGRDLLGLHLPDWQALRDLCLGAAAALPGVTIQGWDIALCSRGPVVIEANITGDFDLPQAANAKGLLTPQLESLLKQRGVF